MSSIQIIAILCFLIINTNAGLIDHPDEMEHGDPSYEYQYAVHDDHTGDIKDHFEHRSGDYVIGRYSFIEPDGFRRIVEYTSDPLTGFRAHVRREPLNLQHRKKKF